MGVIRREPPRKEISRPFWRQKKAWYGQSAGWEADEAGRENRPWDGGPPVRT